MSARRRQPLHRQHPDRRNRDRGAGRGLARHRLRLVSVLTFGATVGAVGGLALVSGTRTAGSATSPGVASTHSGAAARTAGAVDAPAPAPPPQPPTPLPAPTAPAAPPTTAEPTTTTTLPALVHPTDVASPQCVVQVQRGQTLSLIAREFPDDAVTYDDIARENGIRNPDLIDAGAYLDVCVGNEINDITGNPRNPANPGAIDPATLQGVAAQQAKLNQLFFGMGMPELALDGDAGPLTRRALCAFRVAADLPVSRAEMDLGSDEEQILMGMAALPIPSAASIDAWRWALIDKTCQVMFTGEGAERIVFVYPVSTGEAGYPTRNQDGSRAFRYNPARDNNGWHDSRDYPVGDDNPLNGNMYKPVYFDRGQAIHGSFNVPPSPRSKGCVRLLPENQDHFVSWLGLDDVRSQFWNDPDRINLVVDIQGDY